MTRWLAGGGLLAGVLALEWADARWCFRDRIEGATYRWTLRRFGEPRGPR